MAKKLYNCEKVDLTHSQMVKLREAGDLNLGIENSLATQIAGARGVGPNKTTANAALFLWNLVGLGVLIYSIYLSFTGSWWWFIVGFIVGGFIWNMNKKSHSENYLEAAMIDQEFYERVREFGGWLYEIEETVVNEYLSNKGIDSIAPKTDEENHITTDDEEGNIVSDFVGCMEKVDWMMSFNDVSILPHSKEKIKDALVNSYKNTTDDVKKELLKTGLLALSHFQDGIGENPLVGMVDFEKIDVSKLSPEIYIKMKEGVDEEKYKALSQKSDEEYQAYLQLID